MKLSVLLIFVALTISQAQTNKNYEVLVAKASLLHLQKKYQDAATYYNKAFKIQSPDALTAYKAAGVYSLEKESEKSFRYLQMALEKGWTEADWLVADSYFDFIRKTDSEKWKAIELEAYKKEAEYSKTLKLPSLRKEINNMMLRDQQLRFKKAQTEDNSLLINIQKEIHEADLDNLNKAKKIVEQYGWPKISQIGKDGQNNLWLVVQHADQDVGFQQQALAAMEKLKESKELNLENYAFLYDRIQCNLNYKQLYGTQVSWTNHGEASQFRPMIKEYRVDERRKKLGMESLEVYSLIYGFSYKSISLQESEQKDAVYHKQVQDLINSAKSAYKNKEFQKAYDDYNTASTFLGGMTDEDNFEAAVLFSKIAADNLDEKYKSISLDFLELLNLRKSLNRKKLLAESAFRILYKEPRWDKINNSF